MAACISRPFYAVYNGVKGLASRFFNYIAGKVNAVVLPIFTGYLTACKNLVFANEIQSLDQITKALKELQPHLIELEADLKLLSDNLAAFPESLSTAIKDKFPGLPVDPLMGPDVLPQLTAQLDSAQKTASAAAGALRSLFTEGFSKLPE